MVDLKIALWQECLRDCVAHAVEHSQNVVVKWHREEVVIRTAEVELTCWRGIS